MGFGEAGAAERRISRGVGFPSGYDFCVISRKSILLMMGPLTLAAVLGISIWVAWTKPRWVDLPNGYAFGHFPAGGHKYLVDGSGIKRVGQEVLSYRVEGHLVVGLVRMSLGRDDIRPFILNTKTGLVDLGALSLAPGSGREGPLEDVASLVGHLVSPEPAKYADGGDPVDTIEHLNGFTHPQVERARQKLIGMGTAIYPELAKHLHDERYSRSIVSAAWVNLTVGSSVAQIMAEGIEFSGYGYKWRKNKTGSNGEPSFGVMAAEVGLEKYATYASTRTKSELQKEFVAWKLAKEREFGFVDAKQEAEITGPYVKWLAEH